MRHQNTIGAIALYLLALLLFDVMGLVIKHLSVRYSAMELSAYRNVFGLIPTMIALWSMTSWHKNGRPVRIRQWNLALWRGVLVIFAQVLFYSALGQMAFATATTISYSMALFMVAFAIPILGEKVGWIRWCAVLTGFVGVILVMGVGADSFRFVAVLPLGAAALYALNGLTARLFDDDVPSPLMNLYSTAAAAVVSIALAGMLGVFTPIQSGTDFAWIVVMGACGGCAVLTMVIAFRMTEQSNLAPFSYFGIPFAFILGWVIFDENAWDDLFPGALLIIAAGLLIVWRERRIHRA